MAEIQIVNPEKPKSWMDRLKELSVGGTMNVPVASAPNISSMVSVMKAKDPDVGNWTVRKIRDKETGRHTHATVTRTA